MSKAIWQLQENRARLVLGQLTAELDVALPGLGLQHVALDGQALSSARLMAVELAPGAALTSHPPVETYVRGPDLVATYAELAVRRYAPQIYWRGLTAPRSSHPGACGAELVVSVQTSRLDAHPQLATTSRLRAIETLRLVDPDSSQFAAVDGASASGAWLDPDSGTGCLLMRLRDGDISYVEMVHPQDFVHARLSVAREADLVIVRQQLIHRRMEKGVIVRARVQGWLVGRSGDQAAAASLYREFAASSLPLTA